MRETKRVNRFTYQEYYIASDKTIWRVERKKFSKKISKRGENVSFCKKDIRRGK